VKYATWRAGKWLRQVVDRLAGVGFPDRNGIVLDEDGTPYISYYDAGQGALRVAHLEADRWIVETVDDTFSGLTSAIQIDNGEIFVIYYDTISNSLKCARRTLPGKEPGGKVSTVLVRPGTGQTKTAQGRNGN
jgi:hypothetical protein